MTVRDYIKSIEITDFSIEKCRKKIERLENLAENRSSMRYDNDRIQSSKSKDRIGDLAVIIALEKDKLLALEEKNEKKLDYLEEQINKVDDLDFRKILYYRHLEKMRYEDIADILDCRPQTVQNKHSKAMKEFVKVFIIPKVEESK